jgi:hypothetical protein
MNSVTSKLIKHGDAFEFKQGFLIGSMYHCALCFKPVGNSPLWVEIFQGGSVYSESEFGKADVEDRGYMGHYPIGSTCAKKFADGALKEVAA